MPVLPVRISTHHGNKIVYALIDTGCQESLVSKKLCNELKINGPCLQVCLVTTDGEKKLVNSKNVDLQIGPIDSVCKKYPIYNALMVEKLPSINNCFPNSANLKHFKNASDLVSGGKFPDLVDNNLHLLIGIKESYMTSFSKVRKPFKPDQSYLGRCLLGWVLLEGTVN